MSILELLLFGTLIIWGVYASIQQGMIFKKYGEWIKTLPILLKKPLGDCPTCMSSTFGSVFFWTAYFCGWIEYDYILVLYICYVFALAGANYLISNY